VQHHLPNTGQPVACVHLSRMQRHKQLLARLLKQCALLILVQGELHGQHLDDASFSRLPSAAISALFQCACKSREDAVGPSS